MWGLGNGDGGGGGDTCVCSSADFQRVLMMYSKNTILV